MQCRQLRAHPRTNDQTKVSPLKLDRAHTTLPSYSQHWPQCRHWPHPVKYSSNLTLLYHLQWPRVYGDLDLPPIPFLHLRYLLSPLVAGLPCFGAWVGLYYAYGTMIPFHGPISTIFGVLVQSFCFYQFLLPGDFFYKHTKHTLSTHRTTYLRVFTTRWHSKHTLSTHRTTYQPPLIKETLSVVTALLYFSVCLPATRYYVPYHTIPSIYLFSLPINTLRTTPIDTPSNKHCHCISPCDVCLPATRCLFQNETRTDQGVCYVRWFLWYDLWLVHHTHVYLLDR